ETLAHDGKRVSRPNRRLDMLAIGSWRPQVSPNRRRQPIRNHDRANVSISLRLHSAHSSYSRTSTGTGSPITAARLRDRSYLPLIATRLRPVENRTGDYEKFSD